MVKGKIEEGQAMNGPIIPWISRHYNLCIAWGSIVLMAIIVGLAIIEWLISDSD